AGSSSGSDTNPSFPLCRTADTSGLGRTRTRSVWCGVCRSYGRWWSVRPLTGRRLSPGQLLLMPGFLGHEAERSGRRTIPPLIRSPETTAVAYSPLSVSYPNLQLGRRAVPALHHLISSESCQYCHAPLLTQPGAYQILAGKRLAVCVLRQAQHER